MGVGVWWKRPPGHLLDVYKRQVLGARIPMSADTQKETFQMLIEDKLREEGDYETVRNIHETLFEMIEENKEEPEPLALDKTDLKKIFEESGVPSEKMEEFDKNFEETVGEKTSLLAANIAETRKFNIETPDVIIKVNPEPVSYTQLHETSFWNSGDWEDGRQKD